jgi:hypothetical protein
VTSKWADEENTTNGTHSRDGPRRTLAVKESAVDAHGDMGFKVEKRLGKPREDDIQLGYQKRP